MTIPFITQAKEEYDRTKGEIDNLEVDIQDMTVKLEVLRSRVPLLEQLIYRYEHEDEAPVDDKPKARRGRKRKAEAETKTEPDDAWPNDTETAETAADDAPEPAQPQNAGDDDSSITQEPVSANTGDPGASDEHVGDWRSHVSHKARRLDAKVREAERAMRDGDELAPEWLGRRGLLTEVELALQNPANGRACFERLVKKMDRELEQINSPVTGLFGE